MQYLPEHRQRLGGYLPSRTVTAAPLRLPAGLFAEFERGTGERPISTTMAFVNLLSRLLRDKDLGKLIVPIVPDEARTFGMEALFRQCGTYSHVGQLYEPVDRETLLYYKEIPAGQLLEEGIMEAGSMASFIAAGTAYATHGMNTIPFFIYYSMFGFQRIGDLIWAAADMRCRGFLLGATSDRTTLAGEGWQHQDGHSHLLAYPAPNLLAYDPAFAYELAVIIREGIRRMYAAQEDVFYYLTIGVAVDTERGLLVPVLRHVDRKNIVDLSVELSALGVGIVGSGAGELIAEGVLAMKMGAVAADLSLSMHPHPTLSETLMEAAEVFFGHSTPVYRPQRARQY